jgi:hypothetical protein
MSHRSTPRLLVLHGLRLKGVAEVEAVAGAIGLEVGEVRDQLATLGGEGLAVHRDGLLAGWTLTSEGRNEHHRLLGVELDDVGGWSTVRTGYQRFRGLNPRVLEACSRWQVRSVGPASAADVVRNDHQDASYDGRVLDDLSSALDRARPIGEQLTHTLARFAPYAPHLEDALVRARAGQLDYVTKPVIPSFHTVWFEWHEDLLVTLGLDRASEHAGKGA